MSFFLAQQATTIIGTLIPAILLRSYIKKLRAENEATKRAILNDLDIETQNTPTVGFFHPYCNSGGGGERVLWTAVAFLQRTAPNVVSIVYSGDGEAGKEAIIAKVKTRFNIVLEPSKLHFVFLRHRGWIEDSRWPVFTLLGQSMGSMFLAWEAFTKFMPDLYIDTMGYAFTSYIVHLLSGGSIPVGAYVHYPTISTEMLARVKRRRQGYANAEAISSSGFLSTLKLWYYRIFMYLYASALRRASFIMVNSSWTKGHVDSILTNKDWLLGVLNWLFLSHFALVSWFLSWSKDASSISSRRRPQHVSPTSSRIVYPPCETEELVGFSLEGRERIILSVAQFRPEKDHVTQLRALSELFKEHAEYQHTVKLVMVGGVRNNLDSARIESLRKLAGELGVSDNVEFVVNASHADVVSWLSRASIGISTMVDEHFGINVVELMAAGVIPVVHASGGPLNDIVVPYNGESTGYHATTASSFASALHTALSLSPEGSKAMRVRARASAIEKFSRRRFEVSWEESGWRTWLPDGREM